uniref:Serine/arginine repetitive matrix protein 1-like n=1 Tax=Nicotiana tabacum TaxID=4097 RepID=A0A1S3X2Q5_TOBAC|nr:PREDICTED: serine/arginine repetitive matrix protein 1-like [Nicotiana tabacum]
MSNPQDHPGSPPPPSPSNSSSSTPPSESPKPRFRRQKILARKTVASGALRKVLNERLKASQVKKSPAPNSDSNSEFESFQSATEGEGHGSSDSEKTQEFPTVVSSSVIENLETRFVLVGPIRDVKLAETSRSEEVRRGWMKSGGSGSGEAAEGLVHLSKRRDEPVSSTKETLADILRKIGTSYDSKKRKATTPKAPNVPKPSKKRKTSSPKPTASLMPKGRDTRSRVKQSEADLQKALEESKKKKVEKGKGKVVESSEVVEEEEMELVHQERGTKVEVPTPKPKKSTTSSKKSSSIPVSAEPPLAKRTKSVVKAKQAKVLDDEKWSGEEKEEESEKEQDKFAIFGRRKC